MKSSLVVKTVLLLCIMFALAAPFTFVKPTVTGKTFQELLQEALEENNKKIPEKPLHNVQLPDFAKILDIETKKKTFFNFIKPAVIKQNKQLLATRAKLNTWFERVSLESALTAQEYKTLNTLVKKYNIDESTSTLAQLTMLRLHVDIIPIPLVLVQAANESAWGTSRFSRIGLNFFGIWCYQQGCGMVPNQRNSDAKHEVAAFNSVDEAVTSYFDNINSHYAYRDFRTIRFELRAQGKVLSAEALAAGLLPYSERGVNYVNDIILMLRQNKHYFIEEA